MKAEFSEFSYGVVLSQQLVALELSRATIMPLLNGSPATVTASSDARVPDTGWPIFLQINLAECMLTPRANGWSEHEERFFRLSVHHRRRGNTHNLLRCLSEVEPEVYYVAPAFHRRREFTRFVASQQIVRESRFFPLTALPRLSWKGRHFITYRPDTSGLRWHASRSQQVDAAASGADWLAHLEKRAEQYRLLGSRFLLDLREKLVLCLQNNTTQPRLFDEWEVDLEDVTPQGVMSDVRNLLLTQFALEVFVLRRK